jgi:hypothetical protein
MKAAEARAFLRAMLVRRDPPLNYENEMLKIGQYNMLELSSPRADCTRRCPAASPAPGLSGPAASSSGRKLFLAATTPANREQLRGAHHHRGALGHGAW